MKYFHVTDGAIDDGPRDLPKAWRNVSGLHLADAETLQSLGWLPQEIVGMEPFDEATQTRSGPINDVQADKVVSTYTVTDKSLSDVRAAWRAELAAIRYAKEIGGIVLNGVPINTDRQDQAMITGAMVAFSSGAVSEIKWKSAAGFVTLDASAFTAVATAVAGHIQACFANEAALSGAIDSASEKPDLNSGWPA